MEKPQKALLKAIQLLNKLPRKSKYDSLAVAEYPFDLLLLSLSSLYRKSRQSFLAMGGQFFPKVCSVARSLSDKDLFRKEIYYSPLESELLWFCDQGMYEVTDAAESARHLMDIGGISLFHEQNHRIVWNLLPPPPEDKVDFLRYLNFAESIVVGLDLALADELGKRQSHALEEIKSIYRTTSDESWSKKPTREYWDYLSAAILSTYFLLEGFDPRDLPKGLRVVFPEQHKLVKAAVKRSLDLSQHFVSSTNRMWQDRHWQFALDSLLALRGEGAKEGPLCLADDPIQAGEQGRELLKGFSNLRKMINMN
jgi:hypothetical protein